LAIDAGHHNNLLDNHLPRSFEFGFFKGLVDSLEVDDYEDEWWDKDEEHGDEDYPESVHTLPCSV
jgi:hypothetical protein